MPGTVLEGKEQQISKSLDTNNDFDIEFIKKTVTDLKFKNPEEVKKIYEIFGKLLVEYNENFNFEDVDRIKRLKATILSEYNSFLDYIKNYYSSNDDLNIDKIAEKYFQENSIEFTDKIKKTLIDKITIAKEEIFKTLIDVFEQEKDKQKELLTNYNKLVLEYNDLKAQKKKLFNSFVEIVKINKKLINQLKDHNIQLNKTLIDKSKKYEKEIFALKKENKSIKGKNKKLLGDAEELNTSLNGMKAKQVEFRNKLISYHKKYLEFSKAFGYKRGIFENFLLNTKAQITKSFKLMMTRIKDSPFFIKISRRVEAMSDFFKKAGAFMLNNRLTRYIADSKFVSWISKNSKLLFENIGKLNDYIKHTVIPAIKDFSKSVINNIKERVSRIKAKIKRSKAFKFFSGLIKAALAPVAIIAGSLFIVISKGIKVITNLVFATVNFLFNAISFIGKTIWKITKFAYNHIVKPIVSVVFKGLKKLSEIAIDISKKTLTSIIGGFLLTKPGAYSLGYILGYIYGLINDNSVQQIVSDFINEQVIRIADKVSETAIKIKRSKLYKFLEKAYYFIKHNSIMMYYKAKSAIVIISDWVRTYLPKIKAGLANVLNLVGISAGFLLENGRTIRGWRIGRNGFKLIKGASRYAKLHGFLIKLITAVAAAAAIGGAFYLGFTQENELSSDSGQISVKDRYKQLYGLSADTGMKADFNLFLQTYKSKYNDLTQEEETKFRMFHSGLLEEIRSQDYLTDMLNKIMELYEKDEVKTNGTGRSVPGEFRFSFAFKDIVDQILFSNFFGRFDNPNPNKILLGLGPIYAATGRYADYPYYQQLTDYMFLSSVLSYRKRLTDSYVDAFRTLESNPNLGLEKILELIRQKEANSRKDIQTFLSNYASNANMYDRATNVHTTAVDSVSEADSRIDAFIRNMAGHTNTRKTEASNRFNNIYLNYANLGTMTTSGVNGALVTSQDRKYGDNGVRFSVNFGDDMKFLKSHLQQYKDIYSYRELENGDIVVDRRAGSALALTNSRNYIGKIAASILEAYNPTQQFKELVQQIDDSVLANKTSFISAFHSIYSINLHDLRSNKLEKFNETKNPIKLAYNVITNTLDTLAKHDVAYKKVIDDMKEKTFSFESVNERIRSLHETNSEIRAILLTLIEIADKSGE